MHRCVLAETNYRPGSRVGEQPVRLGGADRLSHLYTVGRTGVGKSSLLGNLVLQDVFSGAGTVLFDPHGDLVEKLVDPTRCSRPKDLIYLDLPAPDCVFHFNPVGDVPPAVRPLAAAGLVETFKKLWSDDWGPRLEHLLRNVVFTLLEMPEATLADVPPLLTDHRFRRQALEHVSNEEVRAFWTTEYDRYSPAFRAVVAAPLQNKIGAILADPLLRRVFTGRRSSFRFREVMDEGKVLLVNLAKGRIGEGPATILGSLLVSSLSLAALSRADVPEEKRRPFFVYLDEFHTFSTLSLATMLSELRKYKVGMVLANQYLGQLNPRVRDAVIANAGTLIAFRLGAQDARFLAPEFAPVFEPEDLLSLPNYHIYLRLMINGEPSRPFSAKTMPSSSPLRPSAGRPAVDPSR
jgi:hypothetical protein